MRVALVGNQNSGKTTLFNLLTGTNQKVGNWPGVTIERKSGTIKGTDVEIVDLPGIYSLSPYTSEEEISRKYAVIENPDIIINIVDATSIERSLYLTTQLLELDSDVILALNMEDLLEKKGINIDVEKLSKALGVTIVVISALKGSGIDTLIDHIKEKNYLPNRHTPIYSDDIEDAIRKIEKVINVEDGRFAAVKVLERDILYKEHQTEETEKLIKEIELKHKTDTEEIIASQRYDYIVAIISKCITRIHKESITDKLDKVFLNKWAAIPIFAVIMFLIYFLSVGVVGSWTVDLVDGLISSFKDVVTSGLEAIGASNWVISLLTDGIIAGVGAMLNFVPQLIIMFICISLLEVTGYMSRIAFFLDKIFKKFGLSGKSLIPFIVGSGCSVPGIMTARTIEDEDERKMTIMLTPFIPCSAKLPIIILFSTYFFPGQSGLIAASLYFLAIIVILLCAVIMKKFIYKGNSSAFISELPEYKLPSFKYVARDVLEKVWAFIRRAGTIILLCSVVIWLLLSFTWSFKYTDSDSEVLDDVNIEELANNIGIEYTEDLEVIIRTVDDEVKIAFVIEGEISEYQTIKNIKELEKLVTIEEGKEISVFVEEAAVCWKYAYGIDSSILASIGNALSWIMYPIIGEANWAATVSTIQGLVAKEQVVSSMAVISGFSEETSDGQILFSDGSAFANFTPLAAYAFMIFNLFSAPCFGAIGAMNRELGSKKRMFAAVGFQTGIAWVLAALFFGIGSLIGLII